MTLFLDTSALVKRYRLEAGTDTVLDEMERDRLWVVSALVRTEAAIAFCATVSGDDLELVKARLAADLERCAIVPVDQACLARAIEIGCGLDVRTLVALHLAAADRLPAPVRFLTFDRRQAEAAQALGFDVPDGRLPAEPPV